MRFFLGLSLIIAVSLAKERVHLAGKKPSQLDFVGCPTNNDFYYSGNLSSPLWPAKYPPNDKCYYYMYAEPGKVLNFEFPYYDVETCCDYVTIYDGPSDRYPILARFGGPNMTAPVPVGSYNSTTRFALVTFTSDKQIEQSGFQMNYKSVFSASPCNRDILLMINGMSGMGSQANYVKQLNFLADSLTPGWEVNKNKVRVMINLQIDDDYAVVCKTDDLPNNQILSKTIHDLVQDVPNVMDNNNPSLESLFRYSEGAMGTLGKQMDERNGIEKVSIIIIPSNANNDQDFNESFEFAHKARSSDDSKLIVITVGTNLDVAKLATLAYDSVSALHVDSFDDLPTLVGPINQAICGTAPSSCGP